MYTYTYTYMYLTCTLGPHKGESVVWLTSFHHLHLNEDLHVRIHLLNNLRTLQTSLLRIQHPKANS